MLFKAASLLFIQQILASNLSGNSHVTVHRYDMIKSALDTNPVFCGIPGKNLDITRITAVKGLSAAECGTCLRVCNQKDTSKFTYVMAVDMGGNVLDMALEPFQYLFNDNTGVYGATWEPVDSKHCAGIVTGYDLPNAPQPKYPASPISPPVSNSATSKPTPSLPDEKPTPSVTPSSSVVVSSNSTPSLPDEKPTPSITPSSSVVVSSNSTPSLPDEKPTPSITPSSSVVVSSNSTPSLPDEKPTPSVTPSSSVVVPSYSVNLPESAKDTPSSDPLGWNGTPTADYHYSVPTSTSHKCKVRTTTVHV